MDGNNISQIEIDTKQALPLVYHSGFAFFTLKAALLFQVVVTEGFTDNSHHQS